MTTRPTLLERLDALIARCRAAGRPVSPEDVERLYTDGCAEALSLEVEMLRVKRRMKAARLDAEIDATARARADRLEAHQRELGAQADRLRAQFGQLRSATEWLRLQQEREHQRSSPRAGEEHVRSDQAKPRRSA
jgi:hypothetical protein